MPRWSFGKSVSEPSRRCSSCAAELSIAAVFCSNCGISCSEGLLSRTVFAQNGSGIKRKGSASWAGLKRILSFYGVLLGISLVYGWVQRVARGPESEVVVSGVWAMVVTGYLAYEWPAVAKTFRFRRPKTKIAAELLVITAAVVVFLKFYFAVIDFFDWPKIQLTEAFVQAHWPKWIIFAIISVEPGVFEEIAFRGIIQTQLARLLTAKEAIIIQAALFSVLHLSPIIFVSHFVMGLLLGWVRFRTGHVYFGMLLHMAWNAFCVFKELH